MKWLLLINHNNYNNQLKKIKIKNKKPINYFLFAPPVGFNTVRVTIDKQTNKQRAI